MDRALHSVHGSEDHLMLPTWDFSIQRDMGLSAPLYIICISLYKEYFKRCLIACQCLSDWVLKELALTGANDSLV